MRRPLALLFLAVLCLPAQDLPPGVLTLARIRDRVQQTLDRLPDCACVETVDRYRQPAGKKLQLVDRVVFQVLYSGGRELFAAPGDPHWDTSPLAFVAGGMMGNGLFGLDLKVIFLNNQSIIKYTGEESPSGHREARYDFSISRALSGYTVDHAGASGVVALRGSFWADPETYDVRRLEYHAEEIPPELRYADLSTTTAYDRVRVGKIDVLLPQTSDLRATGVNGEENRNHIEFTHCQEYQAESTLHFAAVRAAPDEDAAATTPQRAAEGTLPAGLRIAVALSAALDDRAPVGSLIEGKVAESVMQKGKVLVPAGAIVKGRIRRMERYSDAGDYFIVALEFMQVETPSASLRFYAELQDVDRPDGAEMLLTTEHVEQGEFHWDRNNTYLKWSNSAGVRVWTHEVPGVGTFFVRGTHLSLPGGFKTVWKTQPYPRAAGL